MDLDQEHRPAVLHQPGSSRTLGRLHPAFGVDVDADQAMSIQDFLERLHAGLFLIGRVNGLVDLGLVGWSQGLAQDIEGFDDPQDLSGERLKINVIHNR